VRSTLGSTHVRRIVAAYTINSLGTWFGLVALLVAVYDHTNSALAVAATIFAGEALPAFVVPVLVARVEASRRRSELSALYFFEALATALIAAILLWHFSLDGTAALAGSALLRSELAHAARAEALAEIDAGAPEAVREGDRSRASGELDPRVEEAERRANAARNVAFSVTFVVGPALGGALVAAAGAPAALIVDVASFLVCGALLLDLHPHVEVAGGHTVRARLQTAWRHVNQAPALRGLLTAEALALIFFETGGPIEVALAKTTLNAGSRGFGLILAAWGVGAVLGSVVFARLVRRPLGTMLCAGTLAIGLGYTGFAIAPSLATACVAALVGGLGNGLQWPSLISVVQQATPPDLQGRLMGAVESMAALCRAIGVPLGGVLVAISSPRTAFFVVGVGATATIAALLPFSRRATPLRTAASDEGPQPYASADRDAAAEPPTGGVVSREHAPT
jgi:hypothetical protein